MERNRLPDRGLTSTVEPANRIHLEAVVTRKSPKIPLPENWPEHVKTGIIHVISLVQIALTVARARSKKRGAVARLQAKVEEQAGEISLLKEELSLRDLRMARVKPRRRPHYRGVERLKILALKAARGWSAAQAAERLFLHREHGLLPGRNDPECSAP
jgi:hypothetical protein